MLMNVEANDYDFVLLFNCIPRGGALHIKLD